LAKVTPVSLYAGVQFSYPPSKHSTIITIGMKIIIAGTASPARIFALTP
jgi:hypothetical protein